MSETAGFSGQDFEHTIEIQRLERENESLQAQLDVKTADQEAVDSAWAIAGKSVDQQERIAKLEARVKELEANEGRMLDHFTTQKGKIQELESALAARTARVGELEEKMRSLQPIIDSAWENAKQLAAARQALKALYALGYNATLLSKEREIIKAALSEPAQSSEQCKSIKPYRDTQLQCENSAGHSGEHRAIGKFCAVTWPEPDDEGGVGPASQEMINPSGKKWCADSDEITKEGPQ